MEKYIDQLKAFLYGVIIYLQMDKEITMILMYLVALDMLFGSIKAATLEDLKFEMRFFWKGLVKKALLLIVIMVLALVSRGLGFEDFRILIINVMKIMILAEGFSIITSLRSIWDKKLYKSNDFISVLLAKIGNILSKYLDKLMKSLDDSTNCF